MAEIPAELRQRNQWVVWRREFVNDRWTKVLYQITAPHLRASSTEPATWSSYAAAVEAAKDPDVEGIGFVFTESDPYSGVDFDKCVAPGGEIHPDVAGLVERLSSYTEFSPSGKGLHVLVRAELNGGRNRTANTPWGGEFENYDRGRYFTVTGAHVPGTPLEIHDRRTELDAIRAEIFPPEESPAAAQPVRLAELPLDDQELLTLARNARNGMESDAVFRGEHRHPSRSEADLALCSLLAFWCGPDPDRVDRLFRQSGLMRDKWESHAGRPPTGGRRSRGR